MFNFIQLICLLQPKTIWKITPTFESLFLTCLENNFFLYILPLLLSPPLTPCLWCSVDEAGTDDQLSQSQSSDLEAKSKQTSPGIAVPEAAEPGSLKEPQPLEDVLSSLEQEGNTSHLVSF